MIHTKKIQKRTRDNCYDIRRVGVSASHNFNRILLITFYDLM